MPIVGGQGLRFLRCLSALRARGMWIFCILLVSSRQLQLQHAAPRLAAVQVVCLGARRRHRLSWAATPPRHAGAAPTCSASLPVRCRMVGRLLSGERPQAFYEQIADHDSAARRVSAVPFSTPNIDGGAISRSHAVPSSGHRSRQRTRFRTRSRMATRMGVDGCLLTCTAQHCRKAGMSQKDQTATLQQSCAG